MMDGLIYLLQQFKGMVTPFSVFDLIDILIMAFIIYKAFMFIRRSSTGAVAKGILLLLGALVVALLLHLNTVSFLLNLVVTYCAVALVVIFQPEIRMLLEKLGKTSVLTRLAALSSNEKEHLVEELVKACTQMSASKTGALISLEQGQDLSDYIKTGTSMNSIVSSELLCSIFQYGTPLHDGAVIIRGVRIACAAAYFPPTTKELPTSYGARHRAAVGISEITDSITIIVSEETGTISIAEAGELKSYMSEELRDYLMTRYQIERREPRQELPQPAVEESAEQEPRTDDLIPTEAVVVKYHRRRKSGRRRRKGGEGSA